MKKIYLLNVQGQDKTNKKERVLLFRPQGDNQLLFR
jgi:hypothetical protein